MKHRTIGSVMTSDVVSVAPGTSFKEVAALLYAHRISGVPVLDEDDKVLGVISETDLMRRQTQQGGEGVRSRRWWRSRAARAADAKARALTAGELMSAPPFTARAEDSIARSARTMAAHGVERLPVLDEEDRLVGIVTRRDLLRVFLRDDAGIREDVIQEVLVGTLGLAPHTVGVRVEEGVTTLEGRVERESEVSIAGSMTARVDGVVAVVNHLTARFDDRRGPGTGPGPRPRQAAPFGPLL